MMNDDDYYLLGIMVQISREGWTSEQVWNWLDRTYPDDRSSVVLRERNRRKRAKGKLKKGNKG
jgi:hypothetical protein